LAKLCLLSSLSLRPNKVTVHQTHYFLESHLTTTTSDGTVRQFLIFRLQTHLHNLFERSQVGSAKKWKCSMDWSWSKTAVDLQEFFGGYSLYVPSRIHWQCH